MGRSDGAASGVPPISAVAATKSPAKILLDNVALPLSRRASMRAAKKRDLPLSNTKLAHHPVILMFKDMAVVHEGSAPGRMIEANQKLHGLPDKHRVPRPLIENIRLASPASENVKVDAMNMDRVAHHLARHLPYLGGAQRHGLIDAIHVERLAVDRQPATPAS